MEDSLESKQIKYEYSDGRERIFISYQSKSFPFVLRLSSYLEDRGVKTWYAPRNIRLEGLWPEKLCEAIQNCKAVLLLYTEDADKSKHVIREVSLADEYNKPILWLKLDSTDPSSKVLKYYLSLVQTIEYAGNDAILEALYKLFEQENINFEQLTGDYSVSVEATDAEEPVCWARGVYAFETVDEAAECAARVYFSMCRDRPETTALLPTGRSAKELFRAMLRLTAQEDRQKPFGDTYLMNDTETFGVRPSHATSRIKAIDDNLIRILRLMNRAPEDSHIVYYGFCNFDEEPEDACAAHLDKHPPSVYGISLSPYMEILGYDLGLHDERILRDGPRTIDVLDETKNYIDERQKSSTIYTVGLGTALRSELVMLLAFEVSKSNAIKRLFREKADPHIPVSLLRAHPNAHVIITKEIAQKARIESIAVTGLSPEEAAKCIVGK